MLDEKDLQAIAQLMDDKLKPVNSRMDSMDKRLGSVDGQLNSIDGRLNKMQEDIETLKEDSKITRNAVNDILGWADDASIQVIPLFKRKAK